MAKILLVQPNKNRESKERSFKPDVPVSLIYVGTAIEDKHDVKIYDRNLNLNDSEFFSFLKKYDPDIIGFTIMTSQMILDFMHLGKLIKKEFPEKIILVGGVHPTVEPDSVLNESYVDYIIRGEGEEAFLEFCDTFDKNPKKLKTLKNINHNPLRPYADMDSLKLPNYNLINLKEYNTFFVHLSRGCPGNCTFCYSCKMWGINNQPFIRTYNAEKIMELFKRIVEEYKIRFFAISDDNFIPFKSRALKVCKFLQRYNVHFFCYGRADYVNDEILKALKKAGCHTIQIGIESGSQRILNLLNKKVTVEQNIEAIRCCKRNGIFCDASFMMGLPTETSKDLKMTIDFIKKTKPEVVNLKMYSPLPGAELFEYCVKKGLLKKPESLEEWGRWTELFALKHNVSEVPDNELINATREAESVNYYKNKLRKFIFWLRVGKVKYVLSKAHVMIKTPLGTRIPFIGYIKTSNKNN